MQKIARRNTAEAPPVVCLVSLGCAKNTVDSERVLAALVQDGFLIAGEPADADLCLVNTCGFIADARNETAAVLRELAGLKRDGRLRAVVALGCLVERAGEIAEHGGFLSDADARIGFRDFLRLPQLCRALLAGGRPAAATRRAPTLPAGFHDLPRLITGTGHSVSLKISEGCSNGCRFCTIPRIRGPQVSRPIREIVAEARQLIDTGARELCLIGQDTTSYGFDLGGRRTLPDLLRALAAIDADVWFRLMYAYPRFLSDEVLDALASDPRFCPYIDLPLQHIADPMLKAMGRGMGTVATRTLLARIRSRLPGVGLRTAFIVGFPGETEPLFDELLAFVQEGAFLHAGVFRYSPEPGTPAARLTGAVPAEVAEDRRNRLLEAQREVSRTALGGWIGRTVEVLLDGPVEKGARVPRGVHWTGRTRQQAPEVDGEVLLRTPRGAKLEPGTRLSVRITDSMDYDLVGDALGC